MRRVIRTQGHHEVECARVEEQTPTRVHDLELSAELDQAIPDMAWRAVVLMLHAEDCAWPAAVSGLRHASTPGKG